MNRPSIALCMIIKNEAHNLGGLLQSVRGCFDQIHITDTGSTDNSLEFIEKINQHISEGQPSWSGLPEIQTHHFDWVDDFGKARDYSFSHATTDYICWIDGDDLLSDSKAFIHWRDNVMHSAHYWLAVYNYSINQSGKVECSFVRERVIKNKHGFGWEHFIHEGLIQKDGKKFWPQRVSSWTINHRRSTEDMKNDHKRNLNIFEKRKYEDLNPRMLFYYGKELFENDKPKEAGRPLMDAIKSGKLDPHDLILAFQFAALAALNCGAIAQAIEISMNALKLIPSRAEIWCILGDAYSKAGDIESARHAYMFAGKCFPNSLGGTCVNYADAYEVYPHARLSEIYLNGGNIKEAEKEIVFIKDFPQGKQMAQALDQVKDLNEIRSGLTKSDHILITCPPQSPVTDWDETTLKEKGHGGSETAAIEVAKWLIKKTGRPVKIFHPRKSRAVMESGVEYIPQKELVGYVHNIEPAAHIAWRHSVPLTKAQTIVWCHDLQLPGGENSKNYDKVMALSEFHKNYLMEINKVPEDKILLGYNGINPDEFEPVDMSAKDPNKIIFSSSPDRGLIQAIDIVKKAREISGLDLKLHCFYGFENMRKGGQGDWADEIEKHVKAHPFVTHHGHVTKPVLYKHFHEAGTWLYVNDFIETYCLTALEATYNGCWPIVRDMGALKYTMKEAISKGMCDFMNIEVIDEASIGLWANTLVDAIIGRKWEQMDLPITQTWEKVADLFIKEFGLEKIERLPHGQQTILKVIDEEGA